MKKVDAVGLQAGIKSFMAGGTSLSKVFAASLVASPVGSHVMSMPKRYRSLDSDAFRKK